METSHCLGRHGFIIFILVVFLSSESSFASKINGSKRGGIPPQGNEYRPLCGINEPSKDGTTFIAACDKGFVFSEIKFADYGQPTGASCETLKRGNCGAPATMRIVKKVN
ncbi:unnamed protein product [Microthlaspi erraticum]|uniref:SUEL-type lectin domain-containing protein n=1 Tax=Microthlaspi erraticum TaxID=1685480 RepID=A0A6D2HTU3_9BRAS|nr:unnamed protein product [Microthlaspi erraticum]